MDVAPSVDRVESFQRLLLAGICVILLLLYIVILIIAHRTYRRLQSQEYEIAEKTYFSGQFLVNQEQERTRVARELHDHIGQTLSAIKYNIESAERGHVAESPDDDKAAPGSRSNHNVALLQDTVEELRRIYMTLRPSMLDELGLQATISWFCGQLRLSQPNLRIEQLIDVREQDLPEQLKIMIFRILQDAFICIVSPRNASVVYLWCVQTAHSLELTIRDDGLNYDNCPGADAINSRVHFGLVSLRERAALSGGNLSLETSADAGNTIRIFWQLH
jgi:signal transduction histidine kinase